MKNPKFINSSAFFSILDSAELENFRLHEKIKDQDGNLLENLDKDIIIDFLNTPDTKVTIDEKDGEVKMLAYNHASNEMIEIKDLGDHFLALIIMLRRAKKIIKDLDTDTSTPIMTAKFIKDINSQLLSFKNSDVGIGRFRDEGRDFAGNRCRASVDVGSKCWAPEKPLNVTPKMKELINWVNTEAFKSEENVLKDIAEFHIRFVKIHPFRDGNGRTARLLTNYLLLLNGYPMMNIPAEDKVNYIACINYALTPDQEIFREEFENPSWGIKDNSLIKKLINQFQNKTDLSKYDPLKDFIENHLIDGDPNCLISNILNYKGKSHIKADEVKTKPRLNI